MLDFIFDCKNNIKDCINDINLQYTINNHLHIINTGITNKEELVSLLPLLGFDKDNLYVDGGRASSSTQDKWVVKDVLRNMDYYPKEYYLLPNTEIQYAKTYPKNVLMYVEQKDINNEGNIFLHRIEDIETLLKSSDVGLKLYHKIKKLGLKIVNGFLDENDFHKKDNFMKSWQELTYCSDIDDAVSVLSKEYSNVYKKDNVVMCETDIKGFKTFNNKEYINVPRIAMTKPSIENGYREFLFGDGSVFSQDEILLLVNIYIDTQIGDNMNNGDIYLFNNITIAHSRESYKDDNRKVLVSMSGLYNDDLNMIINYPDIEYPKALKDSDIRYNSPSVEHQISEKFASFVYDLKGASIRNYHIKDINKYFKRYGYLHIINSRYYDSIPEVVLNKLGFGVDNQFKWGGKDSGRTVRYPKGNGFHSVDKYPANLMLLPHQEIFYQRIMPENMLFHYRENTTIGGRTLVHCGIQLLDFIKKENIEFYNKLRKYGQSIVTGFLDENNDLKDKNFVRSWQDRFGTDDFETALINCKNQTTHFDDCWKDEDMLMTKITIPLFKEFESVLYMMFPRIAYDKPSIINGNRKFIIGNGEEFTDAEVDLLLKAFYYTRIGNTQKKGDILLLNNIKYGHSREPYIEGGIRDVAVIMSGEFKVDEL